MSTRRKLDDTERAYIGEVAPGLWQPPHQLVVAQAQPLQLHWKRMSTSMTTTTL